MQVKEKQSNFELLRIISMLLIVAYHLYEHTEGLMYGPLTFNKFCSMAFGSWGIVGVDCFVFITAWFMVDSNKFRFEKILQVIVQTVVYSIILYIGVQLFTGNTVSVKEVIKCFIGFSYDSYWFVTAYLVLLLIAPLLNLFIKKLSDSQLRKCVVLLFFIFIVWKFVLWASPVSTIELFTYLYILAAYMKRCGKEGWFYKNKYKVSALLVVATMIFSVAVSALPESLRMHSVVKYVYISMLAKFSPVMLLIAVSLFYIISDLRIQSKIINKIGARTFAVYLIHENNFVYPALLWGGVLCSY